MAFQFSAFWSLRRENREQCALRLQQILTLLMDVDDQFQTWYEKGLSKKQRRPVPSDSSTLAGLLLDNNRDTTGEPIKELGYSISLWNGSSAEMSACMGGDSKRVSNFFILECDPPMTDAQIMKISQILVDTLGPDKFVASRRMGAESESVEMLTFSIAQSWRGAAFHR